MHEMTLTQTLLETILTHAGGRKVVDVYLLLGNLSDEQPESVRWYWRDISKGTLAEGAELHFEPMMVEMQCMQCNAVFHLQEEVAECPQCRSVQLRVVSGDDIRLVGIDVEES